MISYVLPTRNRPGPLAETLRSMSRLAGGEVIVVDNASSPPAVAPGRLDGGARVRLIRREENLGAAARNVGAAAARGSWLVMLDDDSSPADDSDVERVVREIPDEVAAIGAEIVRPDGRREAGGLPEVFVGCGAAVRREAFLSVGGYDPAFGYYVEEYDLCARLLAAGWRVRHDRRFRVVHRADTSHRSMSLILRRLVRNNGWVMQRYAPERERRRRLLETTRRYGGIAVREAAADGFAAGMRELLQTIDRQPRRPLDASTFDRFTGLAAVHAVARAVGVAGRRVAVVDPGKNAWAVRRGLESCGAQLVDDARVAELLAIGTLSPGPLWDAWERRVSLPGPELLPPWIDGAALPQPPTPNPQSLSPHTIPHDRAHRS